MRIAIVVLLLLAAGAFNGAAKAEPYAWCAQYMGDGLGGTTSCDFVTYEQCRATVAGVGGYCSPNPRYTGPGQAPRRVRPR